MSETPSFWLLQPNTTSTTYSPPVTGVPIANTRLSWEDIVVIVPYFIYVLIFGLWSSCNRADCTTIQDYFLAGRNMKWFLVGASLFASNIGSAHFIGLAGSGARAGIAVAGFELNAIFILVLLGWVFVPVYLASGVNTMPEYLQRRFDSEPIRLYITFLSMVLYVFTKLSVDLYAGALFIKQTFNTDIYLALGGLIFVSAIFTTAGGLTAVIWTDAIQVVIMILGALILMVTSIREVGGFDQLMVKFLQAMPTNPDSIVPNTDCHVPPEDSWHLLRPHDQNILPWTGMTFGSLINSVWYWCSDQVLVQRVLAATNYSNAKEGCLMAAWLKFMTMWLLVIPGMAARILYPDIIACTNPDYCEIECESRAGCSNMAYTQLVLNLLAPGLRGLIFACILSALISSLTSVYNSIATIFTLDVWKPLIRKNASQFELVFVGKTCIVLSIVVSFMWIFIIQNWSSDLLFRYIQSTSSYLAPPVSAIYILAVFVPRVNKQGASAGLIVGLLTGLLRFILSIIFQPVFCGETDKRPSILQMHYMHFAILLFLLTIIVAYGTSLMFPPQQLEQLGRLTFWTRNAEPSQTAILELRRQSTEDDARALVEPDVEMLRRVCTILSCNSFNFNGADPAVSDPTDEPQWSAEDPTVKRRLNYLAVITMACNIFFYGFWA